MLPLVLSISLYSSIPVLIYTFSLICSPKDVELQLSKYTASWQLIGCNALAYAGAWRPCIRLLLACSAIARPGTLCMPPARQVYLTLLEKLPWAQLPTRHSGSKHPTESRSKRSDRQRSSRSIRPCATERLQSLRTHDTATGIPYLQQPRWAAALSSPNVLSPPDKWHSWSVSQHGGVCSLK